MSAYGATPYVTAWPTVLLESDHQETAAAIVDESLAQAREIDDTLVTKGEIRYGSAGNVLVDVSQGAALLVLGSRGRGQVASLLARFCVRALCPPRGLPDHDRPLMGTQGFSRRHGAHPEPPSTRLERHAARHLTPWGRLTMCSMPGQSRRRDFRRQQVEAEDERQEFIRHAEGLSSSVIRPSLQAIAVRLKACGGDGTLVERPRDAFHGLRLTLWMALDKKITVLDRPDLYPYIRLDLNVARRRFTVWEGDMWERQGASRPADPWELSDISYLVRHRAGRGHSSSSRQS